MAGFNDGQDSLDKSATVCALSAEGKFSPDDCRTQCTLTGIVGRLDALNVQKCPQPISMNEQRLTHTVEFLVSAENTAQEQAVDLFSDRFHLLLDLRARQRPVSTTRPEPK